MKLIDGKVIWELHATHGFALELSLPLIFDAGFYPTWYELLSEAQKDGTNVPKLIARLKEIVSDTLPIDDVEKIHAGLDKLSEVF